MSVEHKPHSEPEVFHLSVPRLGQDVALVRKVEYDELVEQLETMREALERLAASESRGDALIAQNALASSPVKRPEE